MNATPLHLGFRFVRLRAGGSLGSFISLLAMIGLILGVALLIIVLAVMNGFDRELREHILNLVPHVEVIHPESIPQWQTVVEDLQQIPSVVEATPQTTVQGLLHYRQQAEPLQLIGLDFGAGMPAAMQQVLQQENLTGPAEGEVLLSRVLAQKLRVQVGNRVTAIVPGKVDQDGSAKQTKATSLKVVGLFSTHTQLDRALALVTLDEANTIAGIGGAKSIRVQLDDIFSARDQGYRLITQLPYGYGFRDWFQNYSTLYESIQLSRNLVGLLVFLIIAIAAFNVVSMMMMTVIDKRGVIAILKTLGLTQGGIIFTFLIQGGLIGFIGVFIGVVLGLLGTEIVPSLLTLIEWFTGAPLLNSDVYPIDYLPIDIRLMDVVMVVSIALVLNFLAAIYPAWRASKVAPATELRYE